MGHFAWVDNRTLLACQCMMIAVFSVMMVGLRSLYPGLRGISSIAIGFMFGVPATLLLSLHGLVPSLISVIGGGASLCLSTIFLYRGIRQFCCGQDLRLNAGVQGLVREPPAELLPLLLGAAIVMMGVLYYYSLVQERYGPSIFAMTAYLALGRGAMAWTLFRCSRGRLQMRMFSVSMALYALVTMAHAVAVVVLPVPATVTAHHSGQTLGLMLSVIFVCVQGIFYQLMFAGAVTESVHEQAQLDHVCGVLNRRGIECALLAELARTKRTRVSLTVMLVDIDHFKTINDLFGHAAGDESLRAVVRGIGKTIRVYDTLGRFGGDELLVLLPETNAEGALLTAGRIRQGVRAETGLTAASELTLSIGVTCCASAEEMIDVLARADIALYEAKRQGRDCVRLNLGGMPEEDRAGGGLLGTVATQDGLAIAPVGFAGEGRTV